MTGEDSHQRQIRIDLLRQLEAKPAFKRSDAANAIIAALSVQSSGTAVRSLNPARSHASLI